MVMKGAIYMFKMGELFVTNGVNCLRKEDFKFEVFLHDSMKKYVNGDWGDMCEEDKKLNDYSVINGERIVAKYNYNEDVAIYVITEWNRSYTTIMLTEEY